MYMKFSPSDKRNESIHKADYLFIHATTSSIRLDPSFYDHYIAPQTPNLMIKERQFLFSSSTPGLYCEIQKNIGC